MRLIILDNRIFVAGIDWHTKPKQINKAQIKKQGQLISDSIDTYVVRNRQLGFVSTNKDEEYLHAQSLAAVLKVPSSFLGLFYLMDKAGSCFWYVLAVQNGIILGLGDNTYEDKDEAQRAITHISDLMGSKLAGEKVAFDDVESSISYLSHLLPKKSIFEKKYTLQPLYSSKKGNKSFILIFLCLCFVISAGYGVKTYLEYLEQTKTQIANLLFIQNMEEKKADILAHPEKYFPMLWKDKEFATAFFSACQQPLFDVPLSEKGWDLESALCTEKNLRVDWLHKPQGSFVDLPFNASLENNTKAVSYTSIVKKNIFQTTEFSDFFSKSQATQVLYQLTQDIGSRLKLSYENQETQEFKEYKLTISAPWLKGKFEFEQVPAALILNHDLVRELENIPSLYLTGIQYNANSKIWNIKGEFYAKPQ